MELIKDIVRQFYPLLILLSCVTFVLWIFFSAGIFGEEGIFKGGGKVFAPMLGSDELKNDGLSFIGSAGSGYIPDVKYTAGAQSVGCEVSFKEMFSVRKENGTYVSGDTEDGFALYLMDIRGALGESVLETLSAEEIENLQEIPSAFIYDRENDILYCHGSGTYTVYVKIYGNSGGQRTYEFRLPVEAS